MKRKLNIILSGGGTGGHIYPAVAVAEALQRNTELEAEILFVGAQGKMEMNKIPALGYRIEGLPVAGIQRRMTFQNLLLPVKVIRSVMGARSIIRNFHADVVAGFGGYASGPILWCAQRMGIPTVIQEQNSYAGVTNKLLASRARRICVAYEGMDRFFPKDKIVLTGNPLRQSFIQKDLNRGEALRYFGLTTNKPVVLVVGGSLGTRTLNRMMQEHIDEIVTEGTFQVIWQTGKYYEQQINEFMSGRPSEGLWRGAFIDRMDLAYTAADVVVARAGACTVSELCLIGKPTLFVPSPNVAEDHQTKNAMALVAKAAARMIPDTDAVAHGLQKVRDLLDHPQECASLRENMLALGIGDSAGRVAQEILNVVKQK